MASTTNSVSAEQREAERRRAEQKIVRRAETARRIKDIGWSAVIGSAATLILVTSLGWLTTQSVVTAARENLTNAGALRFKEKLEDWVQSWEPINLPVCSSVLDNDVLTLNIAKFVKSMTKGVKAFPRLFK